MVRNGPPTYAFTGSCCQVSLLRRHSNTYVPLCLSTPGCLFQAELEMVQSHGVPSEDVIYSGGCKQLSHIKYAAKSSVDLLVCDNEAELRKIARCHPRAK